MRVPTINVSAVDLTFVASRETSIAEMERATRHGVPLGGMSEDDIWAELHKANIRRGGEHM